MEGFSDALIAFFQNREALIPLAIMFAAFVDGIIIIGFVVNGALLFAVAVYFLSRGDVSFSELVVYALVGATLGDHAGYWIGRLLKERPFDWWPLRNRPHLRERAAFWLSKWGALGLIAGRFFSPTRSVAPFVAAVFGMPYRAFAFGELIASLLWVSVWSTVVLLIVEGYLSFAR